MGVTVAEADARFAASGGDLSLVPEGMYCYRRHAVPGESGTRVEPCPYWALDPSRDEQDNGYCALIGRGDWEEGFGLLWDQCKECGVNDADPGFGEDGAA